MKWIRTLAVMVMVAFAGLAFGADWEREFYLDFGAQGDRPVDAFHKLEDEHDNIYQYLNYMKSANAQATTPINPNEGEVWLDISASPLFRLYRYLDGSWVELYTMDAEGINTIAGTVNYMRANTIYVPNLVGVTGFQQDVLNAKELNLNGDTAFNIPMRVQSASGDTTRNIAEFRDESGTLQSWIDPSGYLRGNASFANSNVRADNLQSEIIDYTKIVDTLVKTLNLNRIDNPYFYSPTYESTTVPSGWYVLGSTGQFLNDPERTDIPTGLPIDHFSIGVVASLDGDGFQKVLKVEPNTEYLFEAWFKANSAADEANILIESTVTQAQLFTASNATATWQSVRSRFNVGDVNAITVKFYATSAADQVFLAWPRLYPLSGDGDILYPDRLFHKSADPGNATGGTDSINCYTNTWVECTNEPITSNFQSWVYSTVDCFVNGTGWLECGNSQADPRPPTQAQEIGLYCQSDIESYLFTAYGKLELYRASDDALLALYDLNPMRTGTPSNEPTLDLMYNTTNWAAGNIDEPFYFRFFIRSNGSGNWFRCYQWAVFLR